MMDTTQIDGSVNNPFHRNGPTKIIDMRTMSFSLVLALLSTTGCLGLSSYKPGPDTDRKQPKDCSGVSCWEPPENTCAAGDGITVYAPSGYCSGGDCFYATGQESCHSGMCDGGVCVSAPCRGIMCIDPPEAICADADRTIYAPSGYCSGGDCKYASKTSTCEHLCVSGACQDSPCAEVFCLKQPAPYCRDDSNLVIFSPEGRCVVAGESTECRHESHTVSCSHGCQGGRCLDDPCAGVLCDRPPTRYCDGTDLVLFEPYGVCDEGGFCTYAEQRHPCIEPCADAKCEEDDACTWVTCDKPPASYCHDASTLRVYDPTGWCEEGFCSYVFSDIIECPGGCEEGRCVDAPCAGVSCDNPPPNRCKGDNLMAWDVNPGTCNDGVCSYEEIFEPCPNGCANGRCHDDPCGGVECSRPPAPYCRTDTVLVERPDNGTCNPESGYCVYETQEVTCAEGCENAECLGDTDTETDTETDTDSPAAPELTWVNIPGGTYKMGSNTGESIEKPVHRVTVQDFKMLKTEVTTAQYRACVDANKCAVPGSDIFESDYANWGKPGRENYPVNHVNWNQALSFCTWIGGRLPSEAEWEYAASNGDEEDMYPWGKDTPTCDNAVMKDTSTEKENGCGEDRTWDVCSKKQGNTSHGLCDMAGNVFEWVQDCNHGTYDGAPTDGSAWEDPTCSLRVSRGGSFQSVGSFLRAAYRNFSGPENGAPNVGFRCAR